jgi:iron complex transport system substrate-binding protein
MSVYLLVLPVLVCFARAVVFAGPTRPPNKNTVIDQAGREIPVREPFKRIISLYGAHTENLFALGLDREIIGVSGNDTYPPETLRKPMFSYHDGILVVSLQPGDVEEMYGYWEALGMLTGKQDRASDMIAHFKTAVSDFTSLTAGLADRKKVYFEAIHSKMKTFSQGSMAIFVLEAAGGINVAADAKPVRGTNIAAYGKERILSHAGGIDVYLAQSGTMNRPTIPMIKNEPGFNVIKAVAEDRIYIVAEVIVSRPTFRLLTGIYEIGRVLYPDIFQENAEAILHRANN